MDVAGRAGESALIVDPISDRTGERKMRGPLKRIAGKSTVDTANPVSHRKHGASSS